MNWPVFAFFFMFTYVAIGRLIKRNALKKPSYRQRGQDYNGTMTS